MNAEKAPLEAVTDSGLTRIATFTGPHPICFTVSKNQMLNPNWGDLNSNTHDCTPLQTIDGFALIK